jgi:hypothetical protein
MTEKIFAYDLNNTSIVTFVAIGITTLVLAYVTLTDTSSYSGSGKNILYTNQIPNMGYNKTPFYRGGSSSSKRNKKHSNLTKRKKLK